MELKRLTPNQGYPRYLKENFKVLDQINFHVGAGEVVGIVGDEGAGKTVLLRMIAQLIQPQDGQILYDGENVHDDIECFKTKLCLCNGKVDSTSYLKVDEYLNSMVDLYGRPLDYFQMLKEEAIQRFDLAESLHQPLHTLTKQQALMVELARCWIVQPQIYLFDDLLRKGNDTFAQTFATFVDEVKKQGKIVIYVTSYVEDVEQLCERVIFLHEGCILADGQVALLKRETNTSSLKEVFMKCKLYKESQDEI